MFNKIELLPGAIFEILVSVADTGILTLSDRYGLMAATLKEDLNEEERRVIDRLIYAVKRGKVLVSSQ
ncbi:hypothetical protein [Spirulina sp. 06S082]|uniref:hypothetical protein n=1 Tax=Spirulina sp. 06S082 TaxID=3110248 RepID=UPI002B210C9C|nr:hypothetical protein [Spirulina sp. 06S082]MEA5467280.1 hypothetical protein [Spirulina sp. 06S082]